MPRVPTGRFVLAASLICFVDSLGFAQAPEWRGRDLWLSIANHEYLERQFGMCHEKQSVSR
jgi:hypothetical protein